MSCKKLKIFAGIFCALFITGSAYAWPLISDESIKVAWNAPSGDWSKFPKGSTHANFCVADTISSSGGCQSKVGTSTNGSDQAMVGLVAEKITANGGYFCVTQFQCEGKDSAYTWNLPPNSVRRCVWLCKNGYSGTGCLPITESEYSFSTGNSACSRETIARSDFYVNTVRTTGGTEQNIEYSIDLLQSRYESGMEMDVMLGVSGWLDNKKGVLASPFLFYCKSRSINNLMDVNFYTSASATKLCLPGYSGENCEKCKATNMCSGYSIAQYKEDLHTMNMSGNCGTFTCKDTTKGFKSANERDQCVACDTNGTMGIAGDGICTKCPAGQLFDKNSKSCKGATALSTSELRYGKGKSSDPANMAEACWAQTDPVKYKACVLGVASVNTAQQLFPFGRDPRTGEITSQTFVAQPYVVEEQVNLPTSFGTLPSGKYTVSTK